MGYVQLTSAIVAEFASRPFVRAALSNPHRPISVLSFYLGIDYDDPTAPRQLRSGRFVDEMSKFWFGGHPEYDALCQPFAPCIRSYRRDDHDDDHDADADAVEESTATTTTKRTVEGELAKLILCDQLSRNCFRGTDEAFQYDDVALLVAQDLAHSVLSSTTTPDGITEQQIEGEFYPPYATFVITGLMHSESQDDHELNLKVLDWVEEQTPNDDDDDASRVLSKWWKNQREFEMDHKKVIDRFGRYPHRNEKKNRKSTKEELEWLNDVDQLPGWAKSQ